MTPQEEIAPLGDIPVEVEVELDRKRMTAREVLELEELSTIPEPAPGEVRIKVRVAGTGFTDTMIRRGRYPDFKGKPPYTPGYEMVGIVDKTGPGVTAPSAGQLVADLCVVGGYTQYAIRPAHLLVPVPEDVDAAEAVCIPLAYLTAYQMLTRYRRLAPGATILVVGASGTVGTALLDLARSFGLGAIGTCSAANLAAVQRFGATAIDYRAGDFVAAVRMRLAKRIPAMADAPYSRGHAGIYDVSPDARAVMGPVPGVERLFVAAAFSGTGFKTAPAVGASMAELILTGASTTVDLTPFGFERILNGRMIESPNEYEMGAGFGHKL